MGKIKGILKQWCGLIFWIVCLRDQKHVRIPQPCGSGVVSFRNIGLGCRLCKFKLGTQASPTNEDGGVAWIGMGSPCPSVGSEETDRTHKTRAMREENWAMKCVCGIIACVLVGCKNPQIMYMRRKDFLVNTAEVRRVSLGVIV